jgi:hypothetical protein
MAVKEISVNTDWVYEAPDVKDNFATLGKTGSADPNGVVQGDYLGQTFVTTAGVPYICTALQDGETDSVWGQITLVGD